MVNLDDCKNPDGTRSSKKNERKDMEPKLADTNKLKDDKKAAASYLRHRAEELDAIMARNYSSKNYTLAAGDARQLAAILDVLGQIELS